MYKRANLLFLICVLFLLIFSVLFFRYYGSASYSFSVNQEAKIASSTPEVPQVTHVPTPQTVKAIYMTGWTAGTRTLREKLVKIIDETEVNAVVIDIKDYTGLISFEPNNHELKKTGAYEKRITDLDEFIDSLHKKNIYVIGRLAAFQDSFQVKLHPEFAVKQLSNKNLAWKDRKGISWIDPGAKTFWDYLALVAEESYSRGFDEINFDYIRFPSDGNMNDIYYPWGTGASKPSVMKEFYSYITSKLRPSGMVLSADLFGMTTTNSDDLNIGQLLPDALTYFDYVAPMVYPSHYPTNFIGLKNPAAAPYEVVKFSMDRAVIKAENASTSPLKLRPWLQDFNLGATYTAEMVRKQIDAVYDSGLTSWMMWSASNRYTVPAYLKE